MAPPDCVGSGPRSAKLGDPRNKGRRGIRLDRIGTVAWVAPGPEFNAGETTGQECQPKLVCARVVVVELGTALVPIIRTRWDRLGLDIVDSTVAQFRI